MMRRLCICLLFFLVLCLAQGLGASAAHPAPALTQLERQLALEQKKAEERRKSLKRLTEEERKLNASLAAAEKRILELERGIAGHQSKLLELGAADNKARKEFEGLMAEQRKTEEAQAEALRLLWEITGRRMAVGGRELTDWPEADREYTWSQELYLSLEQYRKDLEEREKKLMQVLGRRNALAGDMQKRLAAVNDEKSSLLKARLEYDRKLADLRRKRGTAEAELNETLKLISSLNFEITQRAADDIAKMKGRLPWPVAGKMQLRYAPSANPPSRGVGFASPDRSEVRAVAGGKVVHNDVLRGFGTVLIVQHGDDYYTLYAYLGSSPLKVGQDLKSRQVIGTVGFYPAIKGPGLYFELRFKQKAINPEPWFAAKS
ncbi:peptidoglycan DD-metalloendopeptidase family protein [Desulfovibrio sp. OttesenSCG-928-A18]|nr:peptidoglycan DD-metalloendopeptidase family protein [Desulfovibrio sp. OttesenSCG-928-A18]